MGGVTSRLLSKHLAGKNLTIIRQIAESAPILSPLGVPLVELFPSDVSHGLTFAVKCRSCVFGVESESGQLFLRRQGALNYERNTRHDLEVIVQSDISPEWTLTFHVVIFVRDIIDEPPIFEQSRCRVSISRNTPQGTKLLTLGFSDADQSDAHSVDINTITTEPELRGGPKKLSLTDLDGLFSIDHSTHSLVLSGSLLTLKADMFSLAVTVTDLAGLSDTALIHIQVSGGGDIGDDTPSHGERLARQADDSTISGTSVVFTSHNTSYVFDELSPSLPLVLHHLDDSPVRSVLGVLDLEFSDLDMLSDELYSSDVLESSGSGIEPEYHNCSRAFSLADFTLKEEATPFEVLKDGQTCQHLLVSTATLDYDYLTLPLTYPITLQALYNSVALPFEIHLQVELQDRNDNPPTFPAPQISIVFPENFAGIVGEVLATDLDRSLEFSELTYSIIKENGDFAIAADNGSLFVMRSFDYELEDPCYYFNVSAMDPEGLSALVEVEACLSDTNDNCPKFEQDLYEFVIDENNAIGHVLLELNAVDVDSSAEFSSEVSYAIEPLSVTSYFRLDDFGEVLVIRTSLDYEAGQQYFQFQIITSDAGENTCFTNITVVVLNVKDVPPVFSFDFRQLNVPEETYPYLTSSHPENIVDCALATDPEGDNVTYYLPNPSDYFSLSFDEPEKGACLVLLKPFDYESESRFEVEVAATDGSVQAESAFFVIDVTNVNDLAFKIEQEYVVEVPENYKSPIPILNIAVENPVPDTRYDFELEQASEQFVITDNGSIVLRQGLDYEARPQHTVIVRVTDGTNVFLSHIEVNVLPVNEFPPRFPLARNIQRSLREDAELGTLVYTLAVTDSDVTPTQSISYELEYISVDGESYQGQFNSTTSPFAVEQPAPGSAQGKVVSALVLDYETQPREYVIHVHASDGELVSASPLVLNIEIEDANDFAPKFSQDEYTYAISESQDNFEVELEATDRDGSLQYGLITSFAITPLLPLGEDDPPFYISGGYIRNTRRFDFESPPNVYKLRVTASDDYYLSGSANITFVIQDANEFSPTFDFVIYQVSFPEDLNLSSVVLRVNAEDKDGGDVFGSVRYSIQPIGVALSDLPFSINETTGDIILSETVDFDIGQEGADFFVRAEDGGGLYSMTRVFISIEDVNDNPPCPITRRIHAQIVENVPRFEALRRINTYDNDYYTENPEPVFYMVPTYDAFTIESSGRLYLTRTLDYEVKQEYRFDVISSDGIQNCSRRTEVLIEVLNMDDNRPEFHSLAYAFNLTETRAPGVLFNVSAADADFTDSIVEYRLRLPLDQPPTEVPFAVSDQGVVSSTRLFNADDPSQLLVYRLEAVAFNQYGQSTLTPAQVTISIVDVNDHAPIFEQSVYFVSVFENHASSGTPVLAVRAVDEDRSQDSSTVRYDLSFSSESESVKEYVSINETTGDVYVSSLLDYESLTSESYNFTVSASDGTFNSSATLVLSVFDVNEHTPVFSNESYLVIAALQTPLGSQVFRFTAHDEDKSEEFGSIARYQLVRGNDTTIQGQFPFELQPNGTLVTVVSDAGFVQKYYTFSVVAFDGANLSSPGVQVTVELRDDLIGSLPVEHCVQVVEGSVPMQPLLDLAEFEGEGEGLYGYTLAGGPTSFLSLQDSELFLTSALDHEQGETRKIDVTATNLLGDSTTISLYLCVENVNDNPTVFAVTEETLELTDESGVGPQLYIALADSDSNWGLPPSYSTPATPSNESCCLSGHNIITDVNFVLSNPNVPFTVDFMANETLAFAVISNTDNTAQMSACSYFVLVSITDSDGLTSPEPLSLSVVTRRGPVGLPTFSQSSYSFSLVENSLGMFSVRATHISELNACLDPSLSDLQYSIVDQDVPFHIDSDGNITTTSPFDFEASPTQYDFSIEVQNIGGESSSAHVTVYVQDVNEHCPEFQVSPTELQVSEAAGPGEVILRDLAYDGDGSVRYGRILYELTNADQKFLPFAVSSNGSLYVSELLDYESGMVRFDFNVTIADGSTSEVELLGMRCDFSRLPLSVTLSDVNDEPPYFQRLQYYYSIYENTSIGSVVGYLEFDDPDEVGNMFEFFLEPSDMPFAVQPDGSINVIDELDYDESPRRLTFLVELWDSVHYATTQANVTIDLLNINEFPPSFIEQEYFEYLKENSLPSEGILTISASDRDGGLFGEVVSYELSGEHAELFLVDQGGVVRNVREFDYESDPEEFSLTVTARDGGGKSSSVLVRILIYDENDNAPEFAEEEYFANISEASTLEDHVILMVHALDADRSPRFSNVSYDILSDEECLSSFTVDPVSGVVRVIEEIDFEAGITSCHLVLLATDPRGLQGTADLYVQISDSNEFQPVILSASEEGVLVISVHEALEAGALAHQFEALDEDAGSIFGSVVDFELVPLTTPLPLVVNEAGMLYLTQELSKSSTYTFQIFATDGGGLESERVTVILNVTQANFFVPEIVTLPSELSLAVEENVLLAEPVWRLNATDMDGNELEFVIFSGPADVLRLEGVPASEEYSEVNIWLNRTLDFEEREFYHFQIAAHDGFHTSESVFLDIRVLPVNEHRPYFPSTFTQIEVIENAPPYTYQILVTALDRDGDTEYGNGTRHGKIQSLYIIDGSPFFTLVNLTEEGSAVITNTELLDYEFVDGDMFVQVQAVDGGGLVAEEPHYFQIYLTDENDHAPEFRLGRHHTDLYVAEVAENYVGVVLQVMAIDRDSSYAFGKITYSIAGDVSGRFDIDQTGAISLTSPFDYELEDSVYNFTVIAQDTPGRRDEATVSVSLLDENEFAPVFDSNVITISIPENQPMLSVIHTFQANDGDGSDAFGSVSQFQSSNLSAVFVLDPTSGELSISAPVLDYETQEHSYEFEVTAIDLGGLSSTASVTVTITDVNEYAPEFVPEFYSVSIVENWIDPAASELLALTYMDLDGTSTTPTFSLEPGNVSDHFSLTSEGFLTLSVPLDYEATPSLELLVYATEGSLTSANPAHISIEVVNINDNPPRFEQLEYVGCIAENYLPSYPLAQLLVSDPDGPNEASYLFDIFPALPFVSVSSQGEILLESALDYELIQSFHLSVSVSDGNFTSPEMASVTVYVMGTNDLNPTFNTLSQVLNVSETALAGENLTFAFPLYATDNDLTNLYLSECKSVLDSGGLGEDEAPPIDKDAGTRLSYKILEKGTPFDVVVDNTTGHIYLRLKRELDFEADKREYRVTLVASDGDLETLLHSRVVIHLRNEDDNVPVFEQAAYRWTVYENLQVFTAAVSAIDQDKLGTVEYSVTNLPPNVTFSIDQHNGTLISHGPFDYETHPTGINFTIAATDSGDHVTSVDASLILLDVNDNRPVFEQDAYIFDVPENTPVDGIAFQLRATDRDGSAEYSTISNYFIVAEEGSEVTDFPFTIRSDGSIVVVEELDFEEGETAFVFDVVAVDSGNLTSDPPVPVLVNIVDAPDVAPCPTESVYTAEVPENEDYSLFLFRIKLTQRFNISTLTYQFTPDRMEFEVHSFGDLFVVEPLDFELEPIVVFNLTVSDPFIACPVPSEVRITVLNRNDHPPMFTQDSLTVDVLENTPAGQDLAYLNHTDVDGEGFSDLIYYEISPPSAPFRVTGGYFQNLVSLDAESLSSYTVQVQAVEATNIAVLTSNFLTITILVQDENEFVPSFEQLVYREEISEGAGNGTVVLSVLATDSDTSDMFGQVTYAFGHSLDAFGQVTLNGEDFPFAVNATSGEVYVDGVVDFEEVTEYQLSVLALDGGGLSSEASVIVTIHDVNEHAPYFTNESYTIRLDETWRLNRELLSLASLVTDDDGGPVFGNIETFSLLSPLDPSSLPVSVSPEGVIRTANFEVDYESGPREYQFSVLASDGGGLTSTNVLNVTVAVVNGNDHPTQIEPELELFVAENTPVSSTLVDLSDYATDPDEGASELMFFIIEEVEGFELAENGLLLLSSTLDRQMESMYVLYVTIWDGRFYSPLSKLIIRVLGPNLYAPVFPVVEHNVSVAENAPPGTLSVRLEASDLDSALSEEGEDFLFGKVVSYHFSLAPVDHNPFNLIVADGHAILSNREPLDYENLCSYHLAVVAVDGGGLSSVLPVVVNVRVQNENEFEAIFSQLPYSVELLENSLLDVRLSVSDADREGTCGDDGNSPLVFSTELISDPGVGDVEFFISVDSTGRISSNVSLDYESDAVSYLFLVRLEDGDFTDSANLSISVVDKNEHSPVFLEQLHSVSLNESAQVGSVVLQLSASDGDGGPVYGSVVEYRIVSADRPSLPFAVRSDGSGKCTPP